MRRSQSPGHRSGYTSQALGWGKDVHLLLKIIAIFLLSMLMGCGTPARADTEETCQRSHGDVFLFQDFQSVRGSSIDTHCGIVVVAAAPARPETILELQDQVWFAFRSRGELLEIVHQVGSTTLSWHTVCNRNGDWHAESIFEPVSADWWVPFRGPWDALAGFKGPECVAFIAPPLPSGQQFIFVRRFSWGNSLGTLADARLNGTFDEATRLPALPEIASTYCWRDDWVECPRE